MTELDPICANLLFCTCKIQFLSHYWTSLVAYTWRGLRGVLYVCLVGYVSSLLSLLGSFKSSQHLETCFGSNSIWKQFFLLLIFKSTSSKISFGWAFANSIGCLEHLETFFLLASLNEVFMLFPIVFIKR